MPDNHEINIVYLSLGGNEGDRVEFLQKAIDLLVREAGPVVARSSVYQTAAWGITDQPDFLNMAVSLQTAKDADTLLSDILNIETTLGRRRDIKWGPRTIDIDILLFNNEIIEKAGLIVPHPFMQERRFTLVPLAEIAPDYMHPKYHKTIARLLAECPDHLEVIKYPM